MGSSGEFAAVEPLGDGSGFSGNQKTRQQPKEDRRSGENHQRRGDGHAQQGTEQEKGAAPLRLSPLTLCLTVPMPRPEPISGRCVPKLSPKFL